MTDFGKRGAGALHASQHEDGGVDEISVEALSGELADSQPLSAHDLAGADHNADTLADLNLKVSDATLDNSSATRTPSAHKASHQNTGGDEISVAALSGELADNQPPKAHDLAGADHNADTLADLNLKVSDATLDDSAATRTPAGHKASHESAGGDSINVTGLVGATALALLMDATPGRVLRCSWFLIDDGTNANTIKFQMGSRFNGDVISAVDNIVKNATTSGLTLDSAGENLTIECSGLSGNVLFAFGNVYINNLAVDVTAHLAATSNDIKIALYLVSSGAIQDLTSLLDAGSLFFNIFYITDA